MERIDKILSVSGNISRTQAREYIKSGRVMYCGSVVRDCSVKIDENVPLLLDGTELEYNKYIYIMMNKPKGVVSATDDKKEKTVIDLITDKGKRELFPAGRLDKNTTGFMLITDDGDFAHRILSPAKHVEKEYRVVLNGTVGEELAAEFEKGVDIGDCICRPAVLKKTGDNTADVILKEGKYHQIKRMFEKYGLKVVELHRFRMGNLLLDKHLAPGEYRLLNKEEIGEIAQ